MIRIVVRFCAKAIAYSILFSSAIAHTIYSHQILFYDIIRFI